MANQAPVELIKKHLFYEVLMLGETRKKLREQDSSDHIAANAFIETFCIHARNLNEFLHENGRPDTLKASTFATADYERPLITDERRLLFAKINKQISHLTEGRTSVPQEKIGSLEREQMFCSLFDELKKFSEHLKPELRSAWRVIFAQAQQDQV